MIRRKRRRLWIILFLSVAILLGVLATGWNVVLVRDYQHILILAKKLSITGDLNMPAASLMLRMILGTLGFTATLAMTVLIFVKLLKEMRLNQQQSEFLATVSHELKTPIAAIELSSSLIRAGGISETEIRQLWDSHQIELKRLREEVNALLEAARWQSNLAVHKRKPLLLENWIQETWGHWKQILGPHATLVREGEPLTIRVLVDLRSIHLIMDNLFNNAKKFSQTPIPHVVIRTLQVPKKRFQTRAQWQVQVEDQGWGFDPQDSKKIFYRFFRSRNEAPYAISGTGLGLYLAHSASRAMGLTLRGESPGKGKGAIFTLEGSEFIG